jgi:hypothetical protein
LARQGRVSRKAVLTAAACSLLVAVGGCGGGEGVAENTTVTAYVEKPLCAAAERELARQGNRAGDLHVQVVCLPSVRSDSKLNLATAGANARRATQDSTTVAYLEPPDPAAARFTHPILETASIAWISRSSGKAAMARLLHAIEASSSGSRESVREALRKTSPV